MHKFKLSEESLREIRQAELTKAKDWDEPSVHFFNNPVGPSIPSGGDVDTRYQDYEQQQPFELFHVEKPRHIRRTSTGSRRRHDHHHLKTARRRSSKHALQEEGITSGPQQNLLVETTSMKEYNTITNDSTHVEDEASEAQSVIMTATSINTTSEELDLRNNDAQQHLDIEPNRMQDENEMNATQSLTTTEQSISAAKNPDLDNTNQHNNTFLLGDNPLEELQEEAFHNQAINTTKDYETINSTQIEANADFAQIISYNNPIFVYPDDVPLELLESLDAILVMGGGTPMSKHDPSTLVQRSLDDARTLAAGKNVSIVCLSSGLPLSGSDSGPSLPKSQASISASYLLRGNDDVGDLGVIDPDNVYIEPGSLDTLGSAFYSRLKFANPNAWKNILVVVNQLRLDHTQAIFHWIYSLDTTGRGTEGDFNLSFLAPPDIVVETPERKEQVEYVEQQLVPRLRTMKAVFDFMNHDEDDKELDDSKRNR